MIATGIGINMPLAGLDTGGGGAPAGAMLWPTGVAMNWPGGAYMLWPDIVVTVAPSIAGVATEGQTLTGSDGTATGTVVSTARQWYANGMAIGGATGTTYLLTSAEVGKVVTFRVTRTNANGSTAANSVATAAVWGPSLLPSFITHYAGSTVTGVSDGTAAPSWPDSTGSLTATLPAGTGATYLATGGPGNLFPTMRFGVGANNRYTIPVGVVTGSQAATVYFVMRQRSMATKVFLQLGGATFCWTYTATKLITFNNSAGGAPAFTAYRPQGTDPYKWSLVTLVFDTTGVKMRVDGVEQTFAALTNADFTGGTIGGASDGSFPALLDYTDIVLCGAAHNAATITTAEAGLSSRYGLPRVWQGTNLVAAQGDSITYGIGTTGADAAFPLVAAGTIGATWDVNAFGIPSQTLATMVTTAAATIDPLYDVGRTKNVALIYGGTNDLAGGTTGTTVSGSMSTYVAARRAVGWKSIELDCLARTSFTGPQETQRLAYNAARLALYPTATANPRIWTDGTGFLCQISAIVGMTFADGTHPNDAGAALIASDVAAAVLLT